LSDEEVNSVSTDKDQAGQTEHIKDRKFMERVARGETLNLFQKFGRGVSVELSEEGLAELNKKPKTRPVWLVLSYSVRPNPANDSALLPFNLPFTMQTKPSLSVSESPRSDSNPHR
jgi:hypothetical protein